MTRTRFPPITGLLLALPVILQTSCGDRTDALQGQSNTTLTFYGKAVDQDGQPLQGIRFTLRLEAYPEDWTFNTRGREKDASIIKAVSDENGSFAVPLTGCRLIVLEVEPPTGYRQFEDLDTGGSGGQKNDSRYYRLISWGQLLYKTDPGRPAHFVFVQDGAREVSVLPSRGGHYAYGPKWIPNESRWPKEPSLTDVVPKPPLTTTTGHEPPTPPEGGPAQ